MKKLLLIAVAALAIVACKKDKDEPVAPNGGNGNNGGGGTQTEQPTPVPAGFVKQIIKTSLTGAVATTTYNVENNVLKSWVEQNSQNTVTHTLEYNGKNLKTYRLQDSSRGLDELYSFVYENNKLTKITYKTGSSQPDTFIVTTDDKGRITKKENPGVGNHFNVMPSVITFDYGTTTLTVKNYDGNATTTYAYGYKDDNVVAVNYNGATQTYEYDTTVVNDLSNPYILLTDLAKVNVRGHDSDISFVAEENIFANQSKNVRKKYLFFDRVITKNGNKPLEIVKQPVGDRIIYKY